jgi:beta-fructofuranosidase
MTSTAPQGTGPRPVVHLTPPTGWMNDPHGIYWLDGVYHLYFQHVPDAVEWQTGISWGYATSRDLVHWRTAAPVLVPGDADEGIWSGSAVIDDEGRPVLFYTSVIGGDVELGRVRAARWSKADGHWVKGPVVVEPADTATRVFRDPTVFRDGDHWTMVVGSGRSDGTACAEVFSSSDLETWTPVGILASRNTRARHPWTGTAWECPQVIRGDGGAADVLVVSIWDDHMPHDVAAATGTYADGRFSARRWRLLSAGAGHFAASAFTDVEGRSCLIFWIRGITDPSRWAGALSLPYVVTTDSDDLCLEPHPAVAAARVPPDAGRDPGHDGPGLAIDVEWRPRSADRLELVTPAGDVRASVNVDGWTVTVAVRDASSVTVSHHSERLRIIADAQVLEVVADGGLVGLPLPASEAGLLPRTEDADRVAWWHLR